MFTHIHIHTHTQEQGNVTTGIVKGFQELYARK